MDDVVENLVADLLEWIGPDARPYEDVMAAWRTSCPRLPVWEEADDRGFVQRRHEAGVGTMISVTDLGRAFLLERRAHA